MAEKSGDKSGAVLIEVTLDDGSTKKFFSNLEKQADATSKKSSGSVKKIDDTLADATGSSGGIGKFSGGLGKIATRFAAVGAAAVAAGAIIKSAIDGALDGERIIAIEKTFDRIAENQGLAGLRDQLTAAGAGLVDIGSILNDTGQALLNLDGAARGLPDLLKVALDSAKLFGGTAEERFIALTRAVETGNAKILKQQGIIVDTDRVFGNYAQTLGLTISELTAAQRQQALLNEVLEQGQKRAALGGESVQPLSDAFKELSLALKDLRDDLKKSMTNTFTPFFEAIARGAKSAVDEIRNLMGTGDRAAYLTKQIKESNEEIVELEERIKSIGKPTLANWGAAAQAENMKARVVELKKELPTLQKELDSFMIAKTPFGPQLNPNPGGDSGKLTKDQLAAIASRNQQIAALEAAAANQSLVTEQARLAGVEETQQSIFEKKMLFGQQLLALGLQQQAEEAAAMKTYSAANGFNDDQRERARLAIVEKYNQLVLQKTNENQNAITASQRKFAETTKNIIQQGLVQSTTAGLESLGRSLQAGALDFENFGASIANVIGDMAISLGQALIVQGLAVESFISAINSLIPGSGLAAAAAGAGLVIFGSALKASVGKGGGSSSGTGGGFATGAPGGVPVSTMPVTDTPIEETMPEESERRGTTIQVNIQGDVLDSDETGLRVVQIINDAFDKQGVVIKGGVVA